MNLTCETHCLHIIYEPSKHQEVSLLSNRHHSKAERKKTTLSTKTRNNSLRTFLKCLGWDKDKATVPTFLLRWRCFLHSPTNVRHFSVKKKNTRPRAATRPFHMLRSCSSSADAKLSCWLPWWVCVCEYEWECGSPIIAYTKNDISHSKANLNSKSLLSFPIFLVLVNMFTTNLTKYMNGPKVLCEI